MGLLKSDHKKCPKTLTVITLSGFCFNRERFESRIVINIDAQKGGKGGYETAPPQANF